VTAALVREIPQLGRLDVEMPAAVIDRAVVVLEQPAADVDRLAEHLVPDAERRPAHADHVLVQVLAHSETEAKTVARQDLHGRGLLRDDLAEFGHRLLYPRSGRVRGGAGG